MSMIPTNTAPLGVFTTLTRFNLRCRFTKGEDGFLLEDDDVVAVFARVVLRVHRLVDVVGIRLGDGFSALGDPNRRAPSPLFAPFSAQFFILGRCLFSVHQRVI